MSGSYVVGVDGGGTKTAAVLADGKGHLLGRGVAGPANYHVVGFSAACEAIEAAVNAAWADAGLSPQPLRGLCLGLAGAHRPEEKALFQDWARARHPSACVVVVNDVELVLAAGTPEGWGLALISGTGSIAFGRTSDGRTARADGWGHLLGDQGSGYAIGLAALRAVMCAYDGRGPATDLTDAILGVWRLATPSDLVPRVYGAPHGKEEIAALARTVETVAERGDAVAARILATAGEELALAAWAVVQRLGLTGPIPCALAGSVLVKGLLVRQAFEVAAEERGLALAPATAVPEPALGALKLVQGAEPAHGCCPGLPKLER